MNFRDQLLANQEPGPDYKAHRPEPFPTAQSAVKTIAYYLPQYHPIPENDAWWGKGFTEWTNVTKAVPRFVGHYQPHLPSELGFYDLRLPDILRRQAALAGHYGIGGFCLHYYWFSGRRVLDGPIETLLAHPDINFPFCINWANENWTRRWDGKDEDVLLVQAYSDEDDIAFARALEPLLRDRRYIRIEGRPLIMLYRPALLPDAAATVRRWRSHFTAAGLGNPYLVMAQCFDDADPRPYGMDAAAEFPPHKVGWSAPNLASSARRFTGDYAGRLLSYDHMVRAAHRSYEPGYTVFRGVCPSWDNEARKPNRGVTFVNGSPAKYRDWLAWACRNSMAANAPAERIVFINAWNEWAEGAHLEPDRHFGYAYLAATADALASLASPERSASAIVHNLDLPSAQMNWMSRAKQPLRRMKRALLS